MVHGKGTPEENAVELQAAYNAAKNMAGKSYSYTAVSDTNGLYADFTMSDTSELLEGESVRVGTVLATIVTILADIIILEFQSIEDKNAVIAYGSTGEIISSTVNNATVIIAPGIYTFGSTKFNVNTNGIDLVSLTGNADVKLDGINVTADYLKLVGIDGGSEANSFILANDTVNVELKNCKGNFFSENSLSQKFISCSGTYSAFDDISGIFLYCTVTTGVFPTIVGGHATYCTNADGSAAVNQ